MLPAKGAEPLHTRHVFLDTNAYYGVKYNLANPAMALLLGHIRERRVVLHVTDITFEEIRRHILEEVSGTFSTIRKSERDVARWKHSSASLARWTETALDHEKVAHEVFASFRLSLVSGFQAEHHSAMAIKSVRVFADYFRRSAPFDKDASKEFPDAFVLHALSEWASETNNKLIVVTRDKAMQRYIDADSRLSWIDSLQDLLARASAETGEDANAAAYASIGEPSFARGIEVALKDQFHSLEFRYVGDLDNGAAYGGRFLRLVGIPAWKVVGYSDDKLSLYVDVEIDVEVEVSYIDRDIAMYDKETNRWFGATTEYENIVDRVFVSAFAEIDRKTGLSDIEIPDQTIDIAEADDDIDRR